MSVTWLDSIFQSIIALNSHQPANEFRFASCMVLTLFEISNHNTTTESARHTDTYSRWLRDGRINATILDTHNSTYIIDQFANWIIVDLILIMILPRFPNWCLLVHTTLSLSRVWISFTISFEKNLFCWLLFIECCEF